MKLTLEELTCLKKFSESAKEHLGARFQGLEPVSLDESQPIPVGDFVHEGTTYNPWTELEYDPSEAELVFLAGTIEDQIGALSCWDAQGGPSGWDMRRLDHLVERAEVIERALGSDRWRVATEAVRECWRSSINAVALEDERHLRLVQGYRTALRDRALARVRGDDFQAYYASGQVAAYGELLGRDFLDGPLSDEATVLSASADLAQERTARCRKEVKDFGVHAERVLDECCEVIRARLKEVKTAGAPKEDSGARWGGWLPVIQQMAETWPALTGSK